jgi:hypothetical protein
MSLIKNATTAQLTALQASGDSGHEANFSLHYVAQAREVYAAELEQLRQVNLASHEGVFEVTIRTRTRTITVPVSASLGSEVICGLQEEFGQRLDNIQRSILHQLREAENEQEDADGTSNRAQILALCLPQSPAVVVPMHTPTTPRFRGTAARQTEAA